MQSVVRKRDYNLARSSIQHTRGPIRVRVESAHHISARDHASQLAIGIQNKHSLVAADRRITSRDQVRQVANFHGSGKRRYIWIHGFGNPDLLQHVSFIVLMNVQSAPRQLLRHDRSPRHEPHRDAVCDDAH